MNYITAGESHGRCLTAIIEGIPAGMPFDKSKIDAYLKLRQGGYGRGGRMKIESDSVEVTSGVRGGFTMGSPITLVIRNRDFENWQPFMDDAEILPGKEVTKPRPGHADLAGSLKYGHRDVRNVLERASARETAARVAVGAVCAMVLEQFGVRLLSHVVQLGHIQATSDYHAADFTECVLDSSVRCGDREATVQMERLIDDRKASGDSVGGVAEIVAQNVVPGLGSYVQWNKKLDARIAYALMSIQSVKGVSFGVGFEAAARPGSEVHDEIFYEPGHGYYKKTNRAGGIEGGMSNGEDIVARVAFKPIPTLYRPLMTVDMETGAPVSAAVERSDTCAVPAGAVVAETVMAIALTEVYLETFGCDYLEDSLHHYHNYRTRINR